VRGSATLRRGIAIAGAIVGCVALMWIVAVYLWPLPSPDTPRGTVVRYYRLVGEGRDGEAAHLTGPATEASHWTDLSAEHGLIGLSVGAGSKTDTADPVASGYLDPVVFEVSFFQFAGTDTELPGTQYWFVSVGRQRAGAPWRIVQIASGW